MTNNKSKKVIIVGILFIFISASFVSAYQNKNFNQVSHETRFQKSNVDTELNKHCYGTDMFFINRYPVMENPISLKDQGEGDIGLNIDLVDVPTEFSWTCVYGKDWTTRAKNQGNCGSCWLFSAMGAFEGVIKIREDCAELDPDLSEQYVLSCLPLAGSCNGGNVKRCVYYYIMNTSAEGNYKNGVITEDIFTYQSNFDHIPPCSDKPQDWEDFLVPISNYAESWPNLNDPDLKDTIKSLLYQKGPLMAYFWASERFIKWGFYFKNPSKYYPDLNEKCPNYVNHGITIVGWKDDPKIKNGGYWICKNTWGPNWGYNGFFNLEYNCLNMGGFIAWVDYDPESYDWPPVANAGGFYRGEIEKEIIFDGSMSIDPEGDISSFEWDFGDDTSASGPYLSHIYYEKGVYPVTLTVTDSSGQETSQTTLVGVNEEPLRVEISDGIGLKIAFDNPVDSELKNFEYNINIKGLILPNKISGIYQSIPIGGRAETSVNVLGIGFGSVQISIENYLKTVNLLILGPLVKIINKNK